MSRAVHCVISIVRSSILFVQYDFLSTDMKEHSGEFSSWLIIFFKYICYFRVKSCKFVPLEVPGLVWKFRCCRFYFVGSYLAICCFSDAIDEDSLFLKPVWVFIVLMPLALMKWFPELFHVFFGWWVHDGSSIPLYLMKAFWLFFINLQFFPRESTFKGT